MRVAMLKRGLCGGRKGEKVLVHGANDCAYVHLGQRMQEVLVVHKIVTEVEHDDEEGCWCGQHF